MVATEYLTGLYVAIPAYFVVMSFIAYWAHRRTKYLETEEKNDSISAHYLGGRGLGPWVTAGTMFASLFSGYTVIGVPNEAFRTGWLALRWIPSAAGIVVGYAGTGPRLRKCSNVRNHQSPVDFITDRYQSQILRYTVLVLQVVPATIYLAAQVIAIKGTFNSMFNIDADASYPVILIMVGILMFEWVGGLSSVALTDAIQGVIMTASFLLIPCVIKKNFGGWSDLEPPTFPRPELYQSPSAEKQWLFWNFSLVNFSFFTLPHLVQRTYAAKDLKSLKLGYTVLAIGPWFTLFVSVFMGTVGIQMLADNPSPVSPFTSIVEAIMSVGGFARIVGVIAFTASLAAIMSTADSLVIAVSQLISAELVYPAKPDASPSQVKWIGRLVSLATMAFAVLVGLFWDEGITDLSRIQFGLSFQALPAFLIGLFATGRKTDCHPWAIAISAWTGMLLVVCLYFGYIRNNSDAKALDVGITAGVSNFVLLFVLESGRRLLFPSTELEQDAKKTDEDYSAEPKFKITWPGRPDWDLPKLKRFGEVSLTPQMVWKLMEDIREPMTNTWFAVFMLFSLTLVTPFVPEEYPPIDNDGSFSSVPDTVNGLPWWALKIIVLSTIPFLATLVLIYKTPSEFPSNERQVQEVGVNPEFIELTHDEMVRRHTYDERNVQLYRRRSTVRKSMIELGIGVSKNTGETRHLPDEKHRCLSALVLGQFNPNDFDLSENQSNNMIDEEQAPVEHSEVLG